MAGKLSRDGWLSKCQALGITQLALSAEERKALTPNPHPSPQPTLFGSEAGPSA
jgi:hypothetical protein